jgi:thiamine pyrophosphate-dependent acetolactate synthase large subunit-like protein/nitrite reductase/ring-hydroxylating ferredoxin subunit
MSNDNIVWYKVLEDKTLLQEGRVMTVTAGHKEICLTHFEGEFNALDNRCPHQGGPLGEGSIEKGLLRCPWHGWDYHPCTGKAPGFDDGVDKYKLKVEGNEIFVGLPEEKPHKTTVSDIMVETLINWGLDTVFGMVGHSNLGFADAMRRQEEKGNLQYIAIRHEGAASFAASAYGKLTGKPAACFAIAGPGSTNMYTGMWDAKVDRAPLIALTGQVATQVLGTGNFQEVDLVQAFSSVAPFNHRVQTDSKHTELATLAMKHALLNREVSHLTFPDEVQEQPAGEDEKAQTPKNRITPQTIAPPKENLEQAIEMINQAERPMIIMGHGSRFHKKAIHKLAEELNCPVVTTFKGKGLIADDHPLGCGVLGRSGTPIASYFMNEADLLVVFGASFSNHTGITDKTPTIQVDFDPMALAKFHAIEGQLWGEISVTAELLYEGIEGQHKAKNLTNEIAKRKQIWLDEKQTRLKEDRGKGVSSAAIFDSLTRLAPKDAVMCVDVGNNAYSFGRYFECKNHDFLMSGYLGSIGFALPASLGAWTAVKGERPVIAVAGDSGLSQYLAEITTLVRHNMDVKVIVLNNNELGKISKEQRALEVEVWQTEMHNPGFAEYANSCGAYGVRVSEKEALDNAMQMVLNHKGPALLEIIADVKLV